MKISVVVLIWKVSLIFTWNNSWQLITKLRISQNKNRTRRELYYNIIKIWHSYNNKYHVILDKRKIEQVSRIEIPAPDLLMYENTIYYGASRIYPWRWVIQLIILHICMKKVIPVSLSKQLNSCQLKHKCKDKIIKVLKDN